MCVVRAGDLLERRIQVAGSARFCPWHRRANQNALLEAQSITVKFQPARRARQMSARQAPVSSRNAEQGVLFEPALALAAGMTYQPEFLTPGEEAALLETIRALPLEEARYKQYTAKRRVASYGSSYDYEANERRPAPPLPSVLLPLRDKAATWAGVRPEDFVHALVAEYRPGTQLGWHRDVPDFEVIVGISLGAACRMRFRLHPERVGRGSLNVGGAIEGRAGRKEREDRARPTTHEPRSAPFDLWLEPRSIYVLRGPARWDWQHSIPPTKTLRHSITLRTLSARGGRGRGA
jgi:alkylated DNA repair dioxygenase AlkB